MRPRTRNPSLGGRSCKPPGTDRNLDGSLAIEKQVRPRVRKLERLAPDRMACRVMIEAPHRHHHQGTIYHVRIDATLPGHAVVVSRDPGSCITPMKSCKSRFGIVSTPPSAAAIARSALNGDHGRIQPPGRSRSLISITMRWWKATSLAWRSATRSVSSKQWASSVHRAGSSHGG